MAQGAGNIAAGLIGGNPGGVSSTKFLNLQAGGRSRIAGVTAAAIVALALAVPFDRVPLSMLAGIVMVTGCRIIDWEFLRRVRSIPPGYTVVMLATATVAVLMDFTMAILVGLVLSGLVDVTRSHRRELERLVSVPLSDTEIWPDADPLRVESGIDCYARQGVCGLGPGTFQGSWRRYTGKPGSHNGFQPHRLYRRYCSGTHRQIHKPPVCGSLWAARRTRNNPRRVWDFAARQLHPGGGRGQSHGTGDV